MPTNNSSSLPHSNSFQSRWNKLAILEDCLPDVQSDVLPKIWELDAEMRKVFDSAILSYQSGCLHSMELFGVLMQEVSKPRP